MATIPFSQRESDGIFSGPGRKLTDPGVFEVLESLKNETFDHQCFVQVSRDPIENREYPVVWCDFSVPAGLNVTAEIQDGDCVSFNRAAKSQYFKNGQATAMFLPEITEREKRMGSFTHQYCARVDVIFEDKLGGRESIFERRNSFEIGYNYKNNEGDEVSDDFTVAMVEDEADDGVDVGLVLLILACGMIGGAIITITLISFIKGKKRRSAASPNVYGTADTNASTNADLGSGNIAGAGTSTDIGADDDADADGVVVVAEDKSIV